MRASLVLALVLSLAACRTSNLGACQSDTQCPSGSVCDPGRAVCVAKAGACLPACDSSHACDSGLLTCVTVIAPQVAIVSPADGTSVSGTLAAIASARAPGGVTALSFELRSVAGDLLASATGAVSATDASRWTGSISLASVADGTANLTAVATWSSGTTASPPVSVTVHQNACFPACPSGQTCQGGACVASACNPACDAAHVCVAGACQPAVTADIAITSPAANAFATGTLQATASAHAPGGVTAVRFDLSMNGSVVATVAGAASGSDPSNFAGTVPLASVVDGAASLTATATYAGGTVTSQAVAITVDQTAPSISMTTDGRTSLFAAGDTDNIVASITDATSGVVDSSVSLAIAGHAPVAGVVSSAGVYGFAVTIDDSIAAAGTTTTVPFSITARDHAGNIQTLASDPKAVIRADRDAPQITAVTYVPSPVTGPGGNLFLGGTAATGPVTVHANITDGAGVAGACLRVGTGTCVAGTKGTGNAWTFSLPRPAAPQDGSVATAFTIESDDSLAAALSGASKAEHQAKLALAIYFDYSGPSITVLADATGYARTAVPIPVSALISDPSGVPDGGVFLNGTLQPSFRDGGLFTFPLDARGLDAGTEGAYTFQVSAKDLVNNVADAGGSRTIDDLPPTVSVRVFKGTDPGAGSPGVTYPTAVANTGWNGTSFIYSDTVHVKGTINDVSGIGAATLHVDGVDLNGAVSVGAQRSLLCTAGAKSCSFDVTFALNDLAGGNGTFHTGAVSDAGIGGAAIPSGVLTLTIDSADQAVNPDHTAAAHAASTPTPATANRLLWQADAGPVSGLAVHADGDLIVTTSDPTAGVDTVEDLNSDTGALRWSFGSAATLGAIPDQPAIGAGTATTAPIYVASAGGDIYAISPAGAELWHASSGSTFAVAPAVDSAFWTDGGTPEQVIVPDSNAGTPQVWRASSTTPVAVTSTDADSFSSPAILGNRVWFGMGINGTGGTTSTGSIESHAINSDGTLGALAAVGSADNRPYFGLITDGTLLYAATRRAIGATSHLNMYSIVPSTGAIGWNLNPAHLSAEPTIGIDGKIYASDYTSHVFTLTPPFTGTTAPAQANLTAEGANGWVPLHGSDGHWYLPRLTGYFLARVGNQISWFFDPPTTILRTGTMDCKGRLFLASGTTVYAFVTDDRGLGDSPWPTLRRDSRNTGNANAPKYGIRTVSGCLQ